MSDFFTRWRQHPDDDAFADLVHSCEGLIRQAACRQFPGDAAAQDELVQAVVCTLHRHASRLRHAGALPAWLLVMTRRMAMNQRRAAATRSRHEREGAAVLGPQMATESSTWTVAQAMLDEALAAMPQRLRESLTTQHLLGRSRAEAARALGIHEEAQKKRVARGADWLRRWYGRRGLKLGTSAILSGLVAEAAAAADFVPRSGLSTQALATTSVNAGLSSRPAIRVARLSEA